MARSVESLLVTLAVAGATSPSLVACRSSKEAARAEAPAAAVPEGRGEAHGQRRRANVAAPVVVDGQHVASLRFGELPETLPATTSPLEGKPRRRHYALAGYLAALGVDLAKVRAVHVGGNGDRYASITGDELRREPQRFLFDFRLATTGLPRTGWWTSGLANTFRVDEIRRVLVYVDRPVPALDARRSCYVVESAPSACDAAIPYLAADLVKGTRLYHANRIADAVKRRAVEGTLVATKRDDGATAYRLVDLLAASCPGCAATDRIELVSGDDVVGRATVAEVAAASVSFSLAPHEHGRIAVDLPAAFQAPGAAATRSVAVTALKRTSAPSTRPLVALDDADSLAATDDAAAAMALATD